MVSVLILSRENRIMINVIKKDITEIKVGIEKMSNHYSKRLPVWATILFTIFGSVIVGLIVAVAK